MGLDGVELLMAIEDEFQIAITNEEAFKCETPNHITDLVFSKLRKSKQEICPSQHGFYMVRKSLMQHFGTQRNEIKPDTKLAEIIGTKARKKNWKKLLSALSDGQTVFAPLTRP